MRVITGTARGTRLKTLEGLDVRPTTDRVKEGMFSSIHFDIPGARVLDLFAGSGQLGIEALSRGADSAVFVDSAEASLRIVRENLEKTGLSGKAVLHRMEAQQFIRRCHAQEFDLIFLDPPYRKGILEEILPELESKLAKNGKIICEHEKELKIFEEICNLRLQKEFVYGKIVVSVMTLRQEEASS